MEENTYKGDVEKAKLLTLKQTLMIVGFAVSLSISGTGVIYRFQTVESETEIAKDKHERDIIALEQKFMDQIRQVKNEGKLAFGMIQESVNSIDKKVDGNYEKSYQRQDNIRDRQNKRLNKLEESGSDKK